MAEHLTKEGLEKLKKELYRLETTGRREVAKKIKQAASQGDISDSADYSEAKEAQAFLEGKIKKLRHIIAGAIIIKRKEGKIAGLGSTIIIESNNTKTSFEIVGSVEADPLKGRISSSSPLGRAIIGGRKGDIVEIEAPRGKIRYKIVEVK